MDIKNILVSSIDVPKIASAVRSFNQEFATRLSKTMETDGMLVPIAVYPNPLKPERYILVNGKARLWAAKVKLKWDLIEARVYDDIKTAEQAELRRDVEQVWHNPLTQAQHVAALGRWHQNWLKNLPASEADKLSHDPEPAATVPADPAAPIVATTAPPVPVDPLAPPVPTPPPPDRRPGTRARPPEQQEATFDAEAAAATGASKTKIRELKALAKAFTEEQLAVLSQLKTSVIDMTAMSRIEDVNKRAAVVALVASGKTLDEAFKATMGAETNPARPTNKRDEQLKEARAAATAAAAEKVPEEDDDTWFNKWCGDKAKMLKNSYKYKCDALLFRRIVEARHVFRSKTKASLAEIKKCGGTGLLWNLIFRTVAVSHPKDWLICPNCRGQQSQPDDEGNQPPAEQSIKPPCTRCAGGGYVLKTEEYV